MISVVVTLLTIANIVAQSKVGTNILLSLILVYFAIKGFYAARFISNELKKI